MNDLTLLIFSLGLFAAIAGGSFVVLTTYANRVQVRQRLKAGGPLMASEQGAASLPFSSLVEMNERLLSQTPEKISQLRLDLQRAGFFSDRAPQIYLLIRTGVLLYLPLLGYLAVQFLLPSLDGQEHMLLALALLFVGFILPSAVLERLKTRQQAEYRRAFPDLLDMLLVCVDAGLSFEAALQRLTNQFAPRSQNLSFNLALLSSELRAGRGLGDAMDGFAERLGLDEARSFSTLLKQSLELGSDIGGALRVYGDEMRDKRAATAEEKANRLPVLMVIPLGLFIFPVLITVILYPAIIKIVDAVRSFSGG
jgi:tight adherence protein C